MGYGFDLENQFQLRPKLVDFMALPGHDQTRAPFVTWNLPDSLLQSSL